jgi:hypothetical protein
MTLSQNGGNMIEAAIISLSFIIGTWYYDFSNWSSDPNICSFEVTSEVRLMYSDKLIEVIEGDHAIHLNNIEYELGDSIPKIINSNGLNGVRLNDELENYINKKYDFPDYPVYVNIIYKFNKYEFNKLLNKTSGQSIDGLDNRKIRSSYFKFDRSDKYKLTIKNGDLYITWDRFKIKNRN